MQEFRAEDGARLAYRDQGDGIALLALAGLTRDGHDFDYLAHHLPDDVRLIRLDSRGRGASDWTGAASYTVAQEARDALALIDHLDLAQVAVIGSSRGGLLGMALAATAPGRLSGLCLNDVGPVLERAGLDRIGTYIGLRPTVPTLEEVADRLAAAMPGFVHVPSLRWAEEAVRHYVQLADGVGLSYDPALREAFEAAMAAPAADLWPLFDACAGLPLALIRGANSDVLSAETATEMRRRRPDMLFAEVPDRGHIPFLDERAALGCITAWLDLLRAR
ncbi:pimeloyl-ACP methyl ester carboxylesterase [Rhodobacter viridis]|uniref:Pimeloyl-ACP methyl ester carboxylesterase n=2 Tax=Rhodobacter viridis TaxID=1054202 RepID=A0A318U286_9RHOB|nr:pimeloyl-ACP methyl ester carboxylesterase [Rhodobacter viridis]